MCRPPDRSPPPEALPPAACDVGDRAELGRLARELLFIRVRERFSY